MTLIPLRFFCSVLLILLLLLPNAVLSQALPEQVAKVGSIAVSKYDLHREMQRILPMNVGFHSGISEEKALEIQDKALQGLIEQSLKVQYAITEEISVPSAEVDARVEKVRKQFDSEAEFETALSGETKEAFRASVYRMLLAKKSEQVAIDEKVSVSEEIVREQYENNKQMYKRPRQYRAQHILIKVDPSLLSAEKNKLYKKAEDLYQQAMAGEDFYNLAYYNSDDRTRYVGGDTGYFHSGQVVKEFEDAIKDLKPGEIVGPVKTLVGYHLIKLTEVQEPHQMSYEEAAPKIRKRMEDKRRETLYQEWMAELKRQHSAEVFIDAE